ncbi:hypothetical protein [Chryseobacterium sp.]|uniref:hypothetical protein n=1 Tax=Chryseobacterium sp. TaxID=1871047 RepID=UPI002355FD32|nr:hypothetical protein [Chryseobacterium sp.]
MKNIFKNTGYRLFTKQQPGSVKISFSYIPNPDGSVRWFWNSNSKKPLFLKFYNAATPKAKLFSWLVEFLFVLRLQKLTFKKETVYYIAGEKPIFDIESDWAIFTGTVGPNNKCLLFSEECFYKIASTEQAKQLVHNEFQSLKISKNNAKYITPSSKMVNEYVLQLSDISAGGERVNELTLIHAKTILDIAKKKTQSTKVADWRHFQDLKTDFESLNDERVPKNLLRKLKLVLSGINENEKVDLSFSHGDFTSWNCYIKDHTLAIYDWELASFERPKGFDFFHFIIQNGILIQKKSWKNIFKEIKEKNAIAFQYDDKELEKYLKFYLLTNTLSYLKIYAEQEKWHVQIHWLLQTWTEALNIFLTENNTERELLIMDIFDQLYHTPYATLKFHNEAPENLKLNSDIDIIISSRNAKKLIVFLSANSLVQNVTTLKKSFMYSVRIITKHHEILNLDLISQLKWKYLKIMNTNEVLENKIKNRFGVHQVSEKDTARFIHLFYHLNESEIPDLYKNFISEHGDSKKTNDKKTIIKVLKTKDYNKGFRFIKNVYHYLKDSFSEKGFIMTFSGVDGAGKSTVISEVSELIEKRYRRPVKVLRHRPSFLPILSVWTKGKEKAHQDAVNSLPRQGNNKSSVSSLFRFGYYYTDYILGQFIIYLKYVLRGKIVLYDRYYFDFIADAKRSNIQLPKLVTEGAYHFLIKPKFNFFLYAAPEKILSRKKELSYKSICDLTAEYSQLFSKLEKKDQNVKYLSIENNDLDTTLDTIMNTIIAAK